MHWQEQGQEQEPYEFGVKSAMAASHKLGQMLCGRTFPGNPYDCHILSAALEQATNLTHDVAVKLKHIVVDLGFRGVDADKPDKEVIHRCKFGVPNLRKPAPVLVHRDIAVRELSFLG